MAFPTGWLKKHKLTIDYTKVSGSADLTDFPVLLTEANFLAAAFDNSQGKEIYTNYLYNDANLQGYWRLESDGTDSSGNGYTVSGTAPTYTTGKFGNGGDFELSSSQYLQIANASCPNLEIAGNKTYSAWLKFESHTADCYPVAKCDSGTTGVFGLRYSTTNGLGVIATGLTPNEKNSGVHPVNGAWYHVVGRHDSTNGTLDIFINGVKYSVACSGTSTDVNGDFAIGRLGGRTSGYYFDGIADDVAVWDRALTDAEVMGLYTGGQDLRFSSDSAGSTQLAHEVVNWNIDYSPTGLAGLSLGSDANLQGYWRLEDTNYTDSSANGYNLAGTTRGAVSGKFGNGIDFESTSSDYISIANASCPNLEISGSQTWQCWVKFESLGDMRFMAKHGATYEHRFGRNSANNITFRLQGSGGTASVDSSVSSSVVAGQWFHMVGVYDSSANTISVFVNGQKTSASAGGVTPADTDGAFYVGSRNGDLYFDGVIDDVAIWNRALTDLEVKSIYDAGCPSEVWVKIPTVSYTTDTVFYVWYDNDTALPQARDLASYGSEAVWTNGQGIWHEEGNYADSSANAYNMGLGTAPTLTASGQIGSAYDFASASTQYLTLADASGANLEITGSRTVSAWFKPDAGDSVYGTIFAHDDGTNGWIIYQDAYRIQLLIRGLTTTTYVNSSSSGAGSAGSLTAGSWHHVVGIYDSTNTKIKVFVNGLKVEATASGSSANSAADFSIGARDKGAAVDLYADGIIDEVRVFNVARTDGWIVTEYNNQSNPATFVTESVSEQLQDPISAGIVPFAR